MAAKHVRLLGLAALHLVGIGTALSSNAKEPAIQKIEVVGSHLSDLLNEGTSRIQIIDRARIENSGRSTLSDLLQDIPQNNAGAFSESFVAGFAPGGSGASLRGLGQKSTLVLINGRRMVSYGFAQSLQDNFVDLNSIPLAAIERIEILSDGASAIYGADAIGGVINIVLSKKYSGIESTVSTTRGSERGGAESRAAVQAGSSSSDGRFMGNAAFEILHREQLKYSDRKWTRSFDFRDQPGGTLGRFTESAYIFPTPLDRVPFQRCREERTEASDLNPILSGSLCTYNPAPFLSALPETDRASFWTNGEYLLDARTTFFASAMGARVKTEQIGVPTTLGNNTVVLDPVTGGVRPVSNVLLANNPSNPFGTPTRVLYAFFDVGPRETETVSRTGSFAGGFRTSIGEYSLESVLTSAKNKVSSTTRNNVDVTPLAVALSVGAYNFTNPDAGTVRAADLRIDASRESVSKLRSLDVKVTGPKLVVGPAEAKVVAGVETRKESLSDRPDDALSSGRILSRGSTEASGSRHVDSAFVEAAFSYGRYAEAQFAVRRDRYSDVGTANSPKIGLRWNLSPSVAVRSSYSRGFRAPTLQEAADSKALFFDVVADPEFGGRPTQFAAIFRGNPKLKPERSTGTNLGIVFRPTATLNLSIDSYFIKQRDLIGADSFQYIVDQAFDGNTLFDGAVQRDFESGALRSVMASFRNLEAVETRGVDIDTSWSTALPTLGKVYIETNINYVSRFSLRPDPESEVTNFVDSNGFVSMPRYKGVLRAGLEKSKYAGWLALRYIPSYDQTFSDSQLRVGSIRGVDVGGHWDLTKSTRLSMSVQNLLDKRPPFDASSVGGLDFEQHSLRGRQISVSIRAKL